MTPESAYGKLAAFGARVLAEYRREVSDLDGADVEAWAREAGVIEVNRVTEPCGEDCVCGAFGFPTECNVTPDAVHAILLAEDANRRRAPEGT